MYKAVIRALLFKFDPEAVHYFTFDVIKLISKIPFISSLIRLLFKVHEKDTYVFKDLRYPLMNEEDPNSSVFNFKIKKKKQRWMAQPFYPKEVKEKDISAFWERLKGI